MKTKSMLRVLLCLLLCLLCALVAVSCDKEPPAPEEHTHSMKKVEAKEPTCTEEGNIAYFRCESCQNNFTDEQGSGTPASISVPALGHRVKEVAFVEPTCTTSGNSQHWRCENEGCTARFSDEAATKPITDATLAATGHDTLTHYEAVSASWDIVGNVEYWECPICHTYFSDAEAKNKISDKESVILPATGHPHFLSHHPAVTPTCEYAGNAEYWECTQCELYFSDEHGVIKIADKDSVVLPAAHDLEHVPAKAPTCWEDGNIEYWYCKAYECYTYFSDANGQTEIQDTATLWLESLHGEMEQDDVCEVCGGLFGTPGLSYTYVEQKDAYAASGMGQCTVKDIVIGNIYNGKRVYKINDWAFRQKGLTSVTVSAGIEQIGARAFADNGLLEEVLIKEGVTFIGDRAFENCYSLTRIQLPSSLEKIGEKVFYEDTYSGRVINFNTFNNSQYLGNNENPYLLLYDADTTQAEFTIPEGTKIVYRNAFRGLDNQITTLHIPASLTCIDGEVFSVMNSVSDQLAPPLENVHITDMDAWCRIAIGDIYGHPLHYADKLLLNGQEVTAVTVPADVTELSIPFYHCTTLTEITFTATPTAIAQGAFRGCTALRKVNGAIPLSQRIFQNCTALVDVTIAEDMTEIPEEAFSGCTALSTIAIPASVENIRNSAFSECIALATVTIAENSALEQIFDGAFYSCGLTSFAMPATVTYVGRLAFESCDELARVDISDLAAWCGISYYEDLYSTCVGNGHTALYLNGEQITELVLPAIEYVRGFCFSGFAGITTVTIPAGITTLGQGLFQNCPDLTTVNMEAQITSLGSALFKGCKKLAQFNLTGSLPEIPAMMFNNTAFTSLEIPAGVTRVGDSAFSGCRALTCVTFAGNDLKSIQSNAFYRSGLKSIEIPSGVTYVGSSAFGECYDLTTLCLPDTVTSVGAIAHGCHRLVQIKNLSGLSLSNLPENMGMEILTEDVAFTGSIVEENDTVIYTYDGNVYLLAYYGDGTALDLSDSGITAVIAKAFYDENKLESLILPDTVTTMGLEALYGCKSLQRITLPFAGESPAGEQRFAYVFENQEAPRSLKSVTLTGCEVLQQQAFSGCRWLEEVILPDYMTSFGKNAFSGCSSLESITIPVGVASWGWQASVFGGCKRLVHVTNLAGVTLNADNFPCNNIGMEIRTDVATPFQNVIANTVDGLFRTFTVGDEVYLYKYLGDSTEADLTGHGFTAIYPFALYYQSAVETVTIPAEITYIGEGAFSNCSALKVVNYNATDAQSVGYSNYDYERPFEYSGGFRLNVGANVTKIPSYLFYEARLQSVVFAEGSQCTVIESGAFSACESLRSINLPEGLLSIGSSAFSNAPLTEIVLPSTLQTIGADAFMYTNLVTITIPASVTYIGSRAFYMTALTEAYFERCEGNCWRVVNTSDSVPSAGSMVTTTLLQDPEDAAYMLNNTQMSNSIPGYALKYWKIYEMP